MLIIYIALFSYPGRLGALKLCPFVRSPPLEQTRQRNKGETAEGEGYPFR